MYYSNLGVVADNLARITLPVKTPPTVSCFTFYYNMVTNGQLKVSAHCQHLAFTQKLLFDMIALQFKPATHVCCVGLFTPYTNNVHMFMLL